MISYVLNVFFDRIDLLAHVKMKPGFCFCFCFCFLFFFNIFLLIFFSSYKFETMTCSSFVCLFVCLFVFVCVLVLVLVFVLFCSVLFCFVLYVYFSTLTILQQICTVCFTFLSTAETENHTNICI